MYVSIDNFCVEVLLSLHCHNLENFQREEELTSLLACLEGLKNLSSFRHFFVQRHPGLTFVRKALVFFHISAYTTAINQRFVDVPSSWHVFDENERSADFSKKAINYRLYLKKRTPLNCDNVVRMSELEIFFQSPKNISEFYREIINLMYFHKSDNSIAWINFCLYSSKKQFLLQ